MVEASVTETEMSIASAAAEAAEAAPVAHHHDASAELLEGLRSDPPSLADLGLAGLGLAEHGRPELGIDNPATIAAPAALPKELPMKTRAATAPTGKTTSAASGKALARAAARAAAKLPVSDAVEAEPVEEPMAMLPVPPVAPSRSPAAEPVAPSQAISLFQLKDMIMDMNTAPQFADGIKGVLADMQSKAKDVYEKSAGSVGEVSEFAKGNVEAMVESGKVFAAGLQEMTTGCVADSKSAFETMTADVKELAAVKSPADFFRLQGDLMRKSFDTAMAYGSKNSEAMVKLANEAFAPLSARVSIGVDKMKQAA